MRTFLSTMRASSIAGRFIRCQTGSAAEFAIVLPVFIMMFVGIIDVGRFMWMWNHAEKATQMGARYAAVTDFIPENLEEYSFADGNAILQGDDIPASAFGGVQCDESSCTNKGAGPTPGHSATAFANLVDHMSKYFNAIEAENVEIDYDWSGLGYAGDPNAPDVSAMITVRLKGLSFTPYSTLAALDMDLPDFAATVTAEDGDGSESN